MTTLPPAASPTTSAPPADWSAPGALVVAVATWGRANRRDLPWRHTRDPWAVLVSEIMLQQTQVARVADRFGPFLASFGDPATCAAAPLGDVLRAWHGLGYPRRARDVHRAASTIVQHHGGRVPLDRAALQALPGVGPYTARAVRAFAFGQPDAVVDTNVSRLLARWSGRPMAASRAQHVADDLVAQALRADRAEAEPAWAWNQAMLDLGSVVCSRRAPACGHCPAAAWCAWHGDGGTAPDPAARRGRSQRRFAGSDRQLRGRILGLAVEGPIHLDAVAASLGEDPGRVAGLAAGLVAEGLLAPTGGTGRASLRLPG